MSRNLTHTLLYSWTIIAAILGTSSVSSAQSMSEQKIRMALDIMAAQQGTCVTIISDPNPPTNLRSMPKAETRNIIGQLLPFTIVSVTNNQDGWLEITAPNKGWVALNLTRASCGYTVDSSFFKRLKKLGELSLSGDRNALDLLVRYRYQGADGVSADVLDSEYLPKLFETQTELLMSNLNSQPEHGRRKVLENLSMTFSKSMLKKMKVELSRQKDSPVAKTWRSLSIR